MVKIVGRTAVVKQHGNYSRADYTPCGELLAEAQALQMALNDLDGKTKRVIALDELVMAVSVETLEHEEDCRCGLCRAPRAVGG